MSHTTSFIVNTLDYFAAHTDAGTIRFGLVGSATIEVSEANTLYSELLACTTSEAVEDIFDSVYAAV